MTTVIRMRTCPTAPQVSEPSNGKLETGSTFTNEMNSSTDRNPILLIHGIWDTTAIFNSMNTYLSERGWAVYSLNLIPNDGRVGLDSLAQLIADFVTQTFDPSQPFDLVGFSMGGLVSRYYVQRLGGIDRIQRFVTLSSPHHGTLTAYALPLPGYIQMRPGSAFLRDLNQDAASLAKVNFTSIWTPFDAMIVPANSSEMPVGRQVKVNVWFHHQMVTHPQSLERLVEVLQTPIPTAKV